VPVSAWPSSASKMCMMAGGALRMSALRMSASLPGSTMRSGPAPCACGLRQCCSQRMLTSVLPCTAARSTMARHKGTIAFAMEQAPAPAPQPFHTDDDNRMQQVTQSKGEGPLHRSLKSPTEWCISGWICLLADALLQGFTQSGECSSRTSKKRQVRHTKECTRLPMHKDGDLVAIH